MYFLDAKAFAFDHRLMSTVLIDDRESWIGPFGAHGFSYMFIYGTWMSFFPNLPIYIFHLFLVIFAAILIACGKLTRRKKWLAILLITTHPIFAYFTFSYMVETIQGVFAVMATLLLIQVYTTTAKFKWSLWGYILIVLALSLIRATWVFWLIGLLPLATSKRQLVGASLLLLSSVGISFYAFKLTHAPFETGFIPALFKLFTQGDWLEAIRYFFSHLGKNLYQYFRYIYTPYYFIMKYLIVFGGIWLIWQGKRKRDQVLVAGGLIAFTNWLVVMVWYDAFEWRDIRVLASVYGLGMLLLVFRQQFRVAYLCLVLHLGFMPFLWQDSYSQHLERADLVAQFSTDEQLKSAIAELQQQITQDESHIYISDEFFKPGNILPTHLPVVGNAAQRLVYSIQFDEAFIENRRGNYFLILPEMRCSAGHIVMKNEYFQLIRLAPLPKE